MGVSAKVQDPGIFQTFWNYFIKEKTTERVHGLVDRVHALGSRKYSEDFILTKRFSWTNLVRPNLIERWEATSDATRRRRSLPRGGDMPGTVTSPAMALTRMGELGPLWD
jgi:hypothetical protein